jgi:8-oxo-dGTP diphosphatase
MSLVNSTSQLKRFAAAVLFDGEKVLLAKRTVTRSNYPGIWDFAGGHCEGDESFEAALEREPEEELGISPTQFSLLMVVDESPDFILNLFLVTKWEGEVHNKDEREHERIEWFEMHAAKQLEFMNGNYLDALERIDKIVNFI